MRLGIIGAMHEEIDLLVEAMEDVEQAECARMEYFSGTLHGTPVVVSYCGMGKVCAAVCAQVMVERYGITQLVFTGVAGSLSSELGIGDIVVSTDCIQHDMDGRGLGHRLGENPDLCIFELPADEALRAMAVEAAREAAPEAGVVEGRVATGDQFIADAVVKQHIVDEFGAICCEMEGGAVAQAAWHNDIPYVVIRSISDNADDDSTVDFRTFLESSARISARIVEIMAERLCPQP